MFNTPSVDDLYHICEEGKSRYAQSIPPGFEDAKNKNGIEMYNDLIIWKETLAFCMKLNADLIFVTDDVKKDWWIQKPNQIDIFHEELVKEFEKFTGSKHNWNIFV